MNELALVRVARSYARLREEPINPLRLLVKPASLPGLALVGGLSVAALAALRLPVAWPVLTAGLFLGAALRDVGWVMRQARLWPLHRQLLDWPKIERLTLETTPATGQAVNSQ